jgi:hypothetical protein
VTHTVGSSQTLQLREPRGGIRVHGLQPGNEVKSRSGSDRLKARIDDMPQWQICLLPTKYASDAMEAIPDTFTQHTYDLRNGATFHVISSYDPTANRT